MPFLSGSIDYDPHLYHSINKEYDHIVWLRDKVLTGNTPGQWIQNAFTIYGDRYLLVRDLIVKMQ